MTWRRPRFDIRRTGRSLLVAYGVVAALNVGFYVLLARPKMLEYRAMSEKNTPVRRAAERLQANVDDLEAYLAALDKAKADLATLRRDILATKNRRMVAVQLELARLAGQFGIDLDQVTYENKILEDEGLERFAMVVPLEGGYANLRSFIRAVEESEQFLVIERVALGTAKQGGVMLQLNITLATYFNAPEAQPSRPAEARAAGGGASASDRRGSAGTAQVAAR
jgi:Tfp pilus assembly protein PilO